MTNRLPRLVKRVSKLLVVGVVGLYAVLLMPEPAARIEASAERQAFVWDRDAYWESLEASFAAARQTGCDNLVVPMGMCMLRLATAVHRTGQLRLPADDAVWDTVQTLLFETGPLLGACPSGLVEFQYQMAYLREAVMTSAQHWDLEAVATRNLMYRLLYGSRIAVEEIMLQAPAGSVEPLQRVNDEPSATPSAELLGVRIHSGDILVSRGGAPTSALIARGNDYPGNFSHIALVYVDSGTGVASIIESHIECGVAVATPEQYMRDTKLRVMVLRPRADLAQLRDNPMLPHQVATASFERAQREHIPYDFIMDFKDSTQLFCSEVASHPYGRRGLKLWQGTSRMSGTGIRSWLAAFGVKYFETQSPSDLEYDPQLRVVAEWRDPETLYKDHVDNAILDAMLEQAEAEGVLLEYDWYMLPFGRVLKVYSVVLNWFGAVGPIPEGMSAASALRNDRFSKRHARVKESVLTGATVFEEQHGYRPPYWELVKLARAAVGEM